MKYLLNAAIFPSGAYGVYRYEPGTVEQLRDFLRDPAVRSRVGYAETVAVIARWTGIHVALSRERMLLNPGDRAMVVRLRYRLPDPMVKSRPVHIPDEDWEIAWIIRET